MLHATPPPVCRADRVQASISAQGAAQGLMITVELTAGRRCRLPLRPDVQVRLGGRLARTAKRTLDLGAEAQTARTLGPGQGAYFVLRWTNECRAGEAGVALRLGGWTLVRRVLIAAPPCITRSRVSTLAVSKFVVR